MRKKERATHSFRINILGQRVVEVVSDHILKITHGRLSSIITCSCVTDVQTDTCTPQLTSQSDFSWPLKNRTFVIQWNRNKKQSSWPRGATWLRGAMCGFWGEGRGGQEIRAIHIPLPSTTQSPYHHQGPSRNWRGVGVQFEVIGDWAGGALWMASLLTPSPVAKEGLCVFIVFPEVICS